MTTQEIKERIRSKATTVWNKIQTFGFWVLLIVAFGGYVGIQFSQKLLADRVKEAIILGSFMQKQMVGGKEVTKIYEIKERVQQ